MVDASPGMVPPQPGTPATPAGGWRRQPPPWRPQPLPPPQRPAKGSEEAGEGGSQAKKEGGAAKVDWRPSPRATGGARRGPARKEQAGGLRTQEQRRRFPQGCGEKEARIRLVGAGGGCRGQAPGGGDAVLPEPTPPSPASPPAARSAPGGDRAGPSGRAEAGEGPHGGGFLQTRSGRDDSRRGRRGRRGACEAGAGERIVLTRVGEERHARGAGSREEAGERGDRPRVPHQTVPTSSSAGQLLTLARGEPRGGRRKRSRRPLLPPPPLPEPGAPAGEGGEVVPGDFCRPPASLRARAGTGRGCRAGCPD